MGLTPLLNCLAYAEYLGNKWLLLVWTNFLMIVLFASISGIPTIFIITWTVTRIILEDTG